MGNDPRKITGESYGFFNLPKQDINNNFFIFYISAITVAPLLLIRDLEKLQNTCERQEVRDFLGFAKLFFEQALADLKKGDIDGALVNFQQLNHQAKQALTLHVTGDKVFVLTQLIILSDVLLHSALPSDRGTIIIPPSHLNNEQRQTISNIARQDCEEAKKVLENKKGEEGINNIFCN